MKLWIMSDMHVDVNRHYPLALPDPRPEHDAVIIAGDICEGTANAVRWIAEQGLNAKPVIFVPGNHEYYCQDIVRDAVVGLAAAGKHDNIHVLDEQSRIFTGPDGERVRISGATLWTDYEYFGIGEKDRCMGAAASDMNDHRLIRLGAGTLRPADCLERFEAAHTWLRLMITHAREEKSRGRIDAHVVVTHHGISEKSVQPKYKTDLLTGAFVSRLDRLVAKANLWVHGHVHNQFRYRIGSCEAVVNPRGYVRMGEADGFDPALVVEVGGRKPARKKPKTRKEPDETAARTAPAATE